MINAFTYFKGSVSYDFDHLKINKKNPLPACPNSPNCVRITVEAEMNCDHLFKQLLQILKKMGVHEMNTDTNSKKIDAVFRIPFFGFKDDVIIQIEEANSVSYLHIKSASRVGYGDLGVNRRRVNRILSLLNIKN